MPPLEEITRLRKAVKNLAIEVDKEIMRPKENKYGLRQGAADYDALCTVFEHAVKLNKALVKLEDYLIREKETKGK